MSNKNYVNIPVTNKDIKVAVCCIACQENAYIREWVEYYKNLGVDKIFLYDNNKSWEANEHFEDVIGDYIESGFVDKIDKRDVVFGDFQAHSYNACYKEHKDEYDWFCFFDCDEFLTIYKFNTIKEFLSQPKFNDFHIININWLSYNDNGNIYKEEGKVQDRFPKPSDCTTVEIMWENRLLKSIVRGGLDQKKMQIGIHNPIPIKPDGTPLMVNISYPDCRERKAKIEQNYKWEYRVCFADGEESFDICYPNCYTPIGPKYDDAVLKHYRTKSCQEYVETKVNRGFQDCANSILNMGTYFYFNEYADEKMEYFMTTNCELPNLLLDTNSQSLGDMMFTYATAKYATKDIKFPYNTYWRFNEFDTMFELIRNTGLFNDVKIFPQTALNDIKFEKNCIEYHYVNNYTPYINYQYMPVVVKPGRNIAFIGDFKSWRYFDLDFVCKLFKNKKIEDEIKKLYTNIDFKQTCALYVNEMTDPEDLKRLFRIYKNYVKYVLIYDNFTYAASVVEKVMQELVFHEKLGISISWLNTYPSTYSKDVFKMYFMSMCRVNFVNFNNSTMWWGAYLNTNDKADILFSFDPNSIYSLLYPVNDIRYKNIKNIPEGNPPEKENM